jgi:hypothetical protein
MCFSILQGKHVRIRMSKEKNENKGVKKKRRKEDETL